MASNLSAFIEVIGSNASRFPNTAQCDLAIYTECNTQAIHFGAIQNSNSTLKISDKSIVMTTTTVATGSNANALSNIKDASSNWYTLSNVGTFSICNISPYGNSNGSIFMGSNGYFTFSNNSNTANSNIAHSNLFSTDFMIESWVHYYARPQVASYSFIGYLVGHMSPTANLNYWSVGVNCNMALGFHVYNAGTSTSIGAYTQSNSIPLNAWTHIGVSYSNNEKALRFYINGIVQSNLLSNNALMSIASASATSASNAGFTNNATLNYVTVGRINNYSNPCYLHDLKFVTGTTYAPSNPPPAPFPLTAGTRLLLRAPPIQSVTLLADTSSNWFNLSNINSVNISSFSFSNAQATTSNGSLDIAPGHIAFKDNGNTANSNIAHSNIITTDFAIESWVYYYARPPVSSAVHIPSLFGMVSPTANVNYWSFGLTSNMQLGFYTHANSTVCGVYTQCNVVSINTWTHIAMSYSNNEKRLRLFVNGYPQSNLTASNASTAYWAIPSAASTFASNQNITYLNTNLGYIVLGRFTGSNNPCYLHDFKMVTGTTYAPTFPPTTPALITPGTRLLLRMVNTSTQVAAVDVSSNFSPLSNVGAVTFCNASPVTSCNSIDLGSNYFTFSNNGNAFPSSNIAHSNLIATDFLIESWVNYYGTPSNPAYTYVPYLIGNMVPSTQTNYWSFGVTSLRELGFYSFTGGAILTQQNAVPLNAWTHIALSYSNNEKALRLYINGVAQNNLALSNTSTTWSIQSSASTFASNIGQTNMNVGIGYLSLGRYNNSNNPCFIHDFKFVTGTTYAPSNPALNFASVTPGTRLLLRATNTQLPQNTTQSTNPLYIAPSGNIGINTSNPQFTLDVNGNTSITGSLFTPGQPYYCAQLPNLGGNTKNAVIGFTSNVQTNFSSSYANNAFTAPVSGVYLISVTSVLGAGSGQAGGSTGEFYIRRNGVFITIGHWNCNDVWENTSAQYAVQLNRNDVIDVFVSNTSVVYTNPGDANGSYGAFSVMMIG